MKWIALTLSIIFLFLYFETWNMSWAFLCGWFFGEMNSLNK